MALSKCGCCSGEIKQTIQQKCPKHTGNNIDHFCSYSLCLEFLCKDCIKQHQQNHLNNKLPDPQISSLAVVEQYFTNRLDNELDYEVYKEKVPKKLKNIEPCETICTMVDEYFYGSTENKIQNMKAQKEGLKQQSNTRRFIDVVERSSHYHVQSSFKQTYFKFLDEILGKRSSN